MMEYTSTPWRIAPTPWCVSDLRLNGDTTIYLIKEAHGSTIDVRNDRGILEHIVRCVNAHDGLVAACRHALEDFRALRCALVSVDAYSDLTAELKSALAAAEKE
jgi:hypothetical protein